VRARKFLRNEAKARRCIPHSVIGCPLPALHDFQNEPRLRTLTVQLRGRPEVPNWSRGCTLSSRTRGNTTDYQGPLQRLLDGGHVDHEFA